MIRLAVLELALCFLLGCTPQKSLDEDADAGVHEDAGAHEGTTCSDWKFDAQSIAKIPDESTGTYRYASTAIADGDILRLWYCANINNYVVRDHIVYRERDVSGQWSEPVTVFSANPDSSAWDGFHVCDPSIVEGKFGYSGHDYRYAMFYSGNNVDAINHVQTGVALADSLDSGGTWTRVADPLLTESYNTVYGVGQPSVISEDGAANLWLFFSRTSPYPHAYVRSLDLSDAEDPIWGEETRLSAEGLSGLDGKADEVLNIDAMVDAEHDLVYVVSERHPLATSDPVGIAEEIALLAMNKNELLSGTGTWQMLDTLDSALTDRPRNHNPGFVRDSFGHMPKEASTPHVFFSDSCEGCGFPAWMFSLKLWEIATVCVPDTL